MAARRLKVLARCASAFLSLVGLQACADDGVSLHVICPIFPDIEDGVCVYDPSGDTCVIEGVMNLALTDVYTQSLRVESGLTARERSVPPQGEPNGLQVRGATVDLRLPNGDRLVVKPEVPGLENPYKVVASGYLPPDATGVVTLALIPPAWANLLRQKLDLYPQLVLAISLKGRTNGGQDVTAGEYAWPVRLLDRSVPCSQEEYCASSKGQDRFAQVCEAQ